MTVKRVTLCVCLFGMYKYMNSVNFCCCFCFCNGNGKLLRLNRFRQIKRTKHQIAFLRVLSGVCVFITCSWLFFSLSFYAYTFINGKISYSLSTFLSRFIHSAITESVKWKRKRQSDAIFAVYCMP